MNVQYSARTGRRPRFLWLPGTMYSQIPPRQLEAGPMAPSQHLRLCLRFTVVSLTAFLRKGHGQSSSIHHGLAILVVGGSNLGSPPRPGAFGSAPATAPLSIPPHHRYRRWMGGVCRLHILLFHKLHYKRRPSSRTLVAARPVTGTADRRGTHLLLIFLLLRGSNWRLQNGRRLRCHCTGGPKKPTLRSAILRKQQASTQSTATIGWAYGPLTTS